VTSSWTVGRGPDGVSRQPATPSHAVPRDGEIAGSFRLEPDPLQSPSPPPGLRRVRRTDSPEVSAPFNGITRTSPVWSGVSSTPTPVPPAGFLDLSAVSWQIRACGLVSCRYRPWVASPFRASPRRDRAPVSGSPAPLRSSPRALHALTRSFQRGFRRRLPHRWGACRVPPAPMDHLSACRPWLARLPVTAGPRAAGSCPTTRIIRFEASFPLQSPRCSGPTGFPRWEQPCSPGRSAPPEPSPPVPGTLADPPHPRSAARTAQISPHRPRLQGSRDPRVG
jgi:hypothetical protein